jgi:putative spermidine/putrescine transport system substrate-binding protein
VLRGMRRIAVPVIGALLLAACSAAAAGTASPGASSPDPANWSQVLSAAQGQTVNWYLWGGDEGLNGYVTGWVTRQAATLGITVHPVKVADTADAITTILGQVQAGRSHDGSVDLVWVNGENFATGMQAHLWACGWPSKLPSARYVDLTAPAIATDFGRPVADCEAAWNTTTSALVYDSARLHPGDVASLAAFQRWVVAHPGRFTYPAPPDFTGSMVVRTFADDQAGGYSHLLGPFDQARYDELAPGLWRRLDALAPSLWRRGATYPATQDAVARLYADGEIDAYFTYGVGGLGQQVADGRLPATTRSAVFSGGNLGNTSFLAIPANSPHQAAAMELADLLQSPAAQYEKKVDPPGYDPAIDTARTGDYAARFAAVPVPPAELPSAVLARATVPELQASWVTRLEKDWVTHVEQR